MRTLKVYGPPGCGKTHRMLGLFEEELRRTKPDRIAFLTFTRAARLEALGRASLPESELPWVRTIHAICYRLLGVSQEQIVKPKDLRNFGKKLGVELTGVMGNPWDVDALTGAQMPTKADRLLQLNHLGRHRQAKLKEMMRQAPQDIDFHYAKWFTQSYRAWKDAEHIIDYTDLLVRYLEVGRLLDLDVVFIDEAQDLSKLQWSVVRKLCSSAKRRYIAGDDDQAIFTWAGASADIFNAESADDTEVLPQSYRLPRTVQDVSQRLIKRVRNRHPKAFNPRDAEGEYRPVGRLSYEHLGAASSFVLFRNHYRGAQLVAQLEELGIPFQGTQSAIDLPGVRDALEAWGRIQNRQPVAAGKARTLVSFANPNLLARDAKNWLAGKLDLPPERIFLPEVFRTDLPAALPRLPRLSYVSTSVAKVGLDEFLKPKVTLMSIHQSKGRQADTVVLDLEMAKMTWDSYLENPDDEHRVFYVGATRAKERLLTLLPDSPMAYTI